MNNIKKISFVKSKIYIFMLMSILSFIYAIFLDFKFGMTFLIVFIIAYFISIFVTLILSKKIYVTSKISKEFLVKGEDVKFFLDIKSKNILPVQFLKVTFLSGERGYTLENKNIVASIMSGGSLKLEISFIAKFWGSETIGIENIVLQDFFGILKINLITDDVIHKYKINIAPKINSVSDDELVNELFHSLNSSDSQEDFENENSFFASPGYEHREYVLGDSLKMINWKLSARLKKYMVRKTESFGSCKPIIILDNKQLNNSYYEQSEEFLFKAEEKLVEGAVSFINSLIEKNIACDLYYCINNSWLYFYIDKFDMVKQVQFELSKFIFEDQTKIERIPSEISFDRNSGVSIVIFSCSYDIELQNQVSEYNNFVVSSVRIRNDKSNIWYIDNEFIFKKMVAIASV